MDDYQFEHFIGDLWGVIGWETEVSQASQDYGIDVTAWRDFPVRSKILIQVKRYGPNNRVGGPEVQQYHSMRDMEKNVDMAMIVTSSEFTSQAIDTAERLNVKLVGGQRLAEIIHVWDAYDLLLQYAPNPQEVPIPADSGKMNSYQHLAESRGITARLKRMIGSRLPNGRWQWVLGTSAVEAASVVLALAMGDQPISGLFVLFAIVFWPLTWFTMYLDRRSTRHMWTPEASRAVRWARLPAVCGFAGLWYVYLRWKYLGLRNPADERRPQQNADHQQEFEESDGIENEPTRGFQ